MLDNSLGVKLAKENGHLYELFEVQCQRHVKNRSAQNLAWVSFF